MANSFYTTITRKFQCPLWPTKAKIAAKYRLYEDSGHGAYLIATECEIVRNLHLPKSKKNKELELYCYCNYEDCPCLKGFEKEITFR